MNLHLVMPVAARDAGLFPRALESVGRAFEFARGHLAMDMVERFCVHVIGDGWDPTMLRKDEFVNWVKRRRRVHPADKPFPDTPHEIYVHVLEKTHGPGVARNLVLAQMEPDDLVCFLDADDDMLPSALLDRMMLCQRYGPTSLVYAPILVEDERMKEKGLMMMRRPLPAQLIKEVISQDNCLIPLQVMTYAGMLQKTGGFEPYLICGEDGNLWRRVIERMSPIVAHTEGPCGIYRWRQKSQSKALHRFHPKAFHLDKQKYGPMGQRLDPEAATRWALLESATSVGARVKAFTQGVSAARLHAFKSEEVGT